MRAYRFNIPPRVIAAVIALVTTAGTAGAQAPQWSHSLNSTLLVDEGTDQGKSPEGGSSSADEESGSSEDAAQETIESLSKRLAEMEQQWSNFQDDQKEESDSAKRSPTFEIGGRIHLDHWAFLEQDQGINYLEHPDPSSPAFGTDPEDRWIFRRIRLEMEGTVPHNMLWRIQVDFNNPNEPQYKDVYLGWDNLPNNQYLLLGNQKRPLGLDAWESSRFTVFAERPLANDAFNPDARRIGLALYGHDDAQEKTWQYGIFNLENTGETGGFVGDSLQLGAYGRLTASPWYDEISGGRGYQHLGLAGSIARPDGNATAAESNANEARFRSRPQARSDSYWLDTGEITDAEWFQQIGLESITNLGALQIAGEYIATSVQRDATGTAENDLIFHGGYIYAAYFLAGEHIPYDRESGSIDRVQPFENFFLVDCCRGGRGNGWGAFQIAARYDFLDLTDNDVLGGVAHHATLGLNWHWTAYSRLQSNLVYGTIDDHEPIVDPALARSFTGGDFWILGTRFMIDF